MQKIKNLIRSTSNTSGNYDKKSMKIRINSDYDLPATKIN